MDRDSFYKEFNPIWSQIPLEDRLCDKISVAVFYQVAHQISTESLLWTLEDAKMCYWADSWLEAAQLVLMEREILG
jgi:hypothetical protein